MAERSTGDALRALAIAAGLVGGSLVIPGCGSPSGRAAPPASNNPFWPQWGLNPQHTGRVMVAGEPLDRQLATIVYDPFVTQEQAEFSGSLLSHYPVPLIDGNDFYMEVKTGTYPSCAPPGDWANGSACGPNAWSQLGWTVKRFTWESSQPVEVWAFPSDWKPEPNGMGLSGWEPVFQPALANGYLYVPGASGTLWKVDKDSGKSVSKIDPFGGANPDPRNTFVSGPVTADAGGNLYYNVLFLADPRVADPWLASDVQGAWLVKVSPQDAATTATYRSLVPGAPPGSATTCPGAFADQNSLPWPPAPTAAPLPLPCGSQRPGVNVAPAVAPDGTIYTVSRAHFDAAVAYLLAVNPDLSPRWQATLERRLSDGCGVIVPIGSAAGEPNSCRAGTRPGVDPTTNDRGSGSVIDQASSSPAVLPDGSVVFGAITNYNASRGHLFKFDPLGQFLGAFDFGWDSTPAVYVHDGTYSIVVKDNHYGGNGLYCSFNGNPFCAPVPPGPFYITQLGPQLNIEWSFQNTNRQPSAPNGFEWCVNAPAIDANGVVYANSEDGNLYAIPQGHSGVFTTPQQTLFLKEAIGAAYTPLSLGPDGKVYTLNAGSLFVVGK
ncbi:MAG TPA: hypothetical protein VN375_11580 [Vicinamibacteria bacterium]|nr:hypothetical protein [Vicinamibacteria bacterium]